MPPVLVAPVEWLAVVLLIGQSMGSIPEAATHEFSDTYEGNRRSIVGFEPSTGKNYPVYIWLAGTGIGWHNRSTDRDLLKRMAALGVVTGECAYDNWKYPLGGCSGYLGVAEPIFNTSKIDSCLSRLCARPTADCSRGVSVHGFSQGAQLTSLAKYFAAQVSAAFVQGHGDNPLPFSDQSDCFDYVKSNGQRNVYHGLAREQVRSEVGEHDSSFSCCYDRPDESCCWRKKSGRVQQSLTTGYNCSDGVRNCLQPDGSGWYMVSDVDAGKKEGANHCFPWAGNCPALAGANDAWNPSYVADCDWCLDSNLRWLRNASMRFAASPATGSDKLIVV